MQKISEKEEENNYEDDNEDQQEKLSNDMVNLFVRMEVQRRYFSLVAI